MDRHPDPTRVDDDTAGAVARPRADNRAVSHTETRAWLLRTASGDADAPHDVTVVWQAAALADIRRIINCVTTEDPAAARHP